MVSRSSGDFRCVFTISNVDILQPNKALINLKWRSSQLHVAYLSGVRRNSSHYRHAFPTTPSVQRLSSICFMHALLFVCQILLHHSTNLSIRIEVLANRSFLIKWTTDFLCSATNCSIGCVRLSAWSSYHHISTSRRRFRTVEHRTHGAILREHAGSSACGLFSSGGLQFTKY